MSDHEAKVYERRRRRADEVLSTHDFGCPVAHVNGWELTVDLWKVPVFLESEAGRPSLRTRVVVSFCPGSSQVFTIHEEE